MAQSYELDVQSYELDVALDSSGVQQGAAQATNALGALRGQTGMVSKAITGLGATFAAFQVGSFLMDAIDQAIKFEDQLAQVRKVTSERVMQEMRREIKAMTEEIPLARKKIAAITEEAGRLGVEGTKNIKDFTEVVSQLSVATNLSARDAAKDFARFASLTQEPIENMENLGSVVNKLSNNMATSADEIVGSMTRAGGAASQFGIEAENISATAAALNEVSASSRRAGTRLRRVFQEMMSPGKIEDIADALNMTTKQFKTMRDESPNKMFLRLVKRFRDSEEAANKMRETFGSASRTALAGLAQNINGLETALGFASDEMDNARSLAREFGVQVETTKSQLQLMENRSKNLKTQLGQSLLPTYNILIKRSQQWLSGINSLIFGIDELSRAAGRGIGAKNFDDLSEAIQKAQDAGAAERAAESVPIVGTIIQGVTSYFDRQGRKQLEQIVVELSESVDNNIAEAFSGQKAQVGARSAKKQITEYMLGLIEQGISPDKIRKRTQSYAANVISNIRKRLKEQANQQGAGGVLEGADLDFIKFDAKAVSRRLQQEAPKMAQEFSSQFKAKMRRAKSDIEENGVIDNKKIIQELNALIAKYRKKVQEATQSGGEAPSVGLGGKTISDFKEQWSDVTSEIYDMTKSWSSRMSQEIGRFVVQGKADFEELGESFLQDFVSRVVKMGVMNPMMNSMFNLGGTDAAMPTLFTDTPGVQEARNGTTVTFAEGDKFAAAQDMGDLQAQVGGGGSSNVDVNVINKSNSQAQVNRQQKGDTEVIDVVIGAVADNIEQGGRIAGATENRYGVNPQPRGV